MTDCEEQRGEGMVVPLPFGSREISDDAPVVVIAEIGINHEGDLRRCLDLIEAAADAGADAVKLQTADPQENYLPGTESYRLYQSAFLDEPATRRAFEYARALNVEPFTTTGLSTLDWIESLEPVCYKISSSTLLHLPLIKRCAETGRPILLSTGMATLDDIEAAVSWVRSCNVSVFALMQCTSLYPARPSMLDLATIPTLRRKFGVHAGFSDHSLGTEAPPLAVAAGARVIEKHLTWDKSRDGFDHRISLDPSGFSEMVEKIRAAEVMLGERQKRLRPEVVEVAARMQRSLVAKQAISAGDPLTDENVGIMRVGSQSDALSPKDYFLVLGSKASRSLAKWAPITHGDVKFE